MIAIGDGDAHDRVTCFFNGGDRVILHRIRFARQPHIDEQTIRSVDVGRTERLGVDWNEPLALLAGQFSQ